MVRRKRKNKPGAGRPKSDDPTITIGFRIKISEATRIKEKTGKEPAQIAKNLTLSYLESF